ncbi:MAG: 1-deoxy-D-xylulose-5-phosphate synthase N-terminal domain-containing protein, partial [Christensenellaceae bacterium]
MEYPYLNQAQDPARLKAMSPEELKLLAQDIREKIVEVVSHNGGHLASNLGVVEAT